MRLAAFDVYYGKGNRASAAAVLFAAYGASEPTGEYTELLPAAAPFVPGEFYRRELPAILALLKKFSQTPDEIIVDGYVQLGDRPGLGYHLFAALGRKIPVIGVAKSRFKGAAGVKVFRGHGTRPLYVTAAGMDEGEAAERIQGMHGAHRIPTLLKGVDRLAREGVLKSK